jgi:hypothetical protein
MRRRIRLIAGLVAFVAIQAMGVVVLSWNWATAEVQSDARLFVTLGAHLAFVMVACAIAALIWGGNAPPADQAATPPPAPPPPSMSPSGIPIGPRTPKPLAAHACAGHDGDA